MSGAGESSGDRTTEGGNADAGAETTVRAGEESLLKALDMVAEGDDLRARLFDNAKRFRTGMSEAGFDLLPGEHPIIPVMLGDAKLAQDFAARALELGVYVIGFSFPVVPRGQARIRTQMNAALTREQLDRALKAFEVAGKARGVIE